MGRLVLALFALLATGACQSNVSKEQALCAKAAAMFERCEDLGPADATGSARLQRDLVVDRWRGLCRAMFTGETQQLLPNALELYQGMTEDVKAQLRTQAECAARAISCTAYAACE